MAGIGDGGRAIVEAKWDAGRVSSAARSTGRPITRACRVAAGIAVTAVRPPSCVRRSRPGRRAAAEAAGVLLKNYGTGPTLTMRGFATTSAPVPKVDALWHPAHGVVARPEDMTVSRRRRSTVATCWRSARIIPCRSVLQGPGRFFSAASQLSSPRLWWPSVTPSWSGHDVVDDGGGDGGRMRFVFVRENDQTRPHLSAWLADEADEPAYLTKDSANSAPSSRRTATRRVSRQG